MIKKPAPGYNPIVKILHWLVALLMLVLIWLGWYMVKLSYYDSWYYASFQVHQWLGLAVWLAGLMMVVSRFARPPAKRQHPLKPLEHRLAVSTHVLLALAVLLTPIAGLIVTVSDGNPMEIGDFKLPLSMEVSDQLRDWAVASHYYLAYGTLGLTLLHALAALKHQFIDHDSTLRRMLW